jgi:hypothetical protein
MPYLFVLYRGEALCKSLDLSFLLFDQLGLTLSNRAYFPLQAHTGSIELPSSDAKLNEVT